MRHAPKTLTLTLLAALLLAWLAPAALAAAQPDSTAKDTTVSKAKPTESVTWAQLDNLKPWELKLTVKAGDPFKAGSAAVTSAGLEQWKTTENSEAKAAFTGSVPANLPQKTYEPRFTGVFKTDGGSGGAPPTWSVKGSFAVKCTYEKGSTDPAGNPKGTSGLAAPAEPAIAHPADLT